MSKANSPIKVLRTAYKRIEKAWSDKTWSEKQDDGNYYVCLEGAVYGFCNIQKTESQKVAIDVLNSVIMDRYEGQYNSIPSFNDSSGRTKDEVLEVIKLGIIRLESGWPDDDYLDDEEVEDLLGSLKD